MNDLNSHCFNTQIITSQQAFELLIIDEREWLEQTRHRLVRFLRVNVNKCDDLFSSFHQVLVSCCSPNRKLTHNNNDDASLARKITIEISYFGIIESLSERANYCNTHMVYSLNHQPQFLHLCIHFFTFVFEERQTI